MDQILSSSALHPSLPNPPSLRRRTPPTLRPRPQRNAAVFARSRGFGEDVVDEDMVVLRKRIREVEISETSEEDPTTAEWMDWEKKYREGYNSDVCEAVGLLQAFLLSTRPVVAFGILGLVLLSISTSAVVVSAHLVQLVNMTILNLI